MKLFDKTPNYTRLDDDVSFGILRTNSSLTTNTKLMYDGEKLFMEAYEANPLLSTKSYKNHRVWKTSLFNRDIKNFLLGAGDSAYDVAQHMSNDIVGDTFDNQFETMYWCGAESIRSSAYPQELGYIAPLYLRKKRPNYFVIFKIDNPSNTNLTYRMNMYKNEIEMVDGEFDFWTDIRTKAKIIKSFDLREGTPIGDYINRYVEQKEFKYDQSIYVNFGTNEIYYYGIDKSLGVLTQKVENFEEQLLNNDNTILRSDDWITSGFKRNNLVFPYIMNIEFLFDDNESNEYEFTRYFGMYCNDIDMFDLNVEGLTPAKITDNENYSFITTDDKVDIEDKKNHAFYYIKDKYGNLSSVGKKDENAKIRIYGKNINVDNYNGFETTSVSTYCERIEGIGHSTMVMKLNKQLLPGDSIYIFDNTKTDMSAEDSDYEGFVLFRATNGLPAGEYRNLKFSCNGDISDTAKALAGAISAYDKDAYRWVRSYSNNNKVVVRATYSGDELNNKLQFEFDETIGYDDRIVKIVDTFDGGTNEEGCLFKIHTSDKDMFFDNSGKDMDSDRYFKSYDNKPNAKILRIIPYINDDLEVDEEYSIIFTDYNGKYVNITKTNQVEIVDKYYPKIGVLSMFPVKDFDFDTIYSSYGENSTMNKELDYINNYLIENDKLGTKTTFKIEVEIDDEDLDFNSDYSSDDFSLDVVVSDDSSIHSFNKDLGYMNCPRFVFDNGDIIDNEYEYYCENLIPELSTISKTVPYISKWGYMDDSKDSCENPYRLNTSKIFETCNFSANTFLQKGDIYEYTHSMPYYLTTETNGDFKFDVMNEYQYIDMSQAGGIFNANPINVWIKYFMETHYNTEDKFLKLFGDTSTSIYKNKRFRKKYSRFLLGSDISNASTLFRGVKFEVIHLKKGKEVKTSKFNDYKFSFIYIPIKDAPVLNDKVDEVNDKVYFIRNDRHKFIVGMVFFPTFFSDTNFDKTIKNNFGFKKGFVYGGSLGFDFAGKNKNKVIMSDVFDRFSVNAIMNNINNGNVKYMDRFGNKDNSYKIKILNPDSIYTYDIFTSVPVMMENDQKNVVGSVDIALKKDTNDLNLKVINRYSGYYNPIFNDILLYNDLKIGDGNEGDSDYDENICNYSNTSFDSDYDDAYGMFGHINNLWFHKVNNKKSFDIVHTLRPYYPLTGQFALDYKKYNVFSTNWDKDYYTMQLDSNYMTRCSTMESMKDELCMFGSKYMQTPNIIEIECLNGHNEWNEDLITNSNGTDNEFMFKEINNSSVDFYFFLHKRLLRYFCDMMRNEFIKYVNPEYSYGITDTLEDDMMEYVEKNILKLYELDKIRVFVKRKKMGIHNSMIENDYTSNINQKIKNLRSMGFVEIKNLRMYNLNTDNFDRKLTYNLQSGMKEDFGFSFVIKKI